MLARVFRVVNSLDESRKNSKPIEPPVPGLIVGGSEGWAEGAGGAAVVVPTTGASVVVGLVTWVTPTSTQPLVPTAVSAHLFPLNPSAHSGPVMNWSPFPGLNPSRYSARSVLYRNRVFGSPLASTTWYLGMVATSTADPLGVISMSA